MEEHEHLGEEEYSGDDSAVPIEHLTPEDENIRKNICGSIVFEEGDEES